MLVWASIDQQYFHVNSFPEVQLNVLRGQTHPEAFPQQISRYYGSRGRGFAVGYTRAMITEEHTATEPIGIFDSGFGGLTVARQIIKALPHEDIIFLGDTLRCPYGPRDQAEVDGFVQQICTWLVNRGVKMIVIACNTATAAGLQHAQQTFGIPIVGVVEPGSRAAVHATVNRRVGVIATKGTVESGIYSQTIRHIDAGITVFSTATPRFVEIAEQGIRMAEGPIESYTSLASKVYIRPAFHEIAKDYLEPLRRAKVDTLVLGCTHFPLLKALIGGVMGRDVQLIDSGKETASDVKSILERKGMLAPVSHEASYEFNSTGDQLAEFRVSAAACCACPSIP